MLDLVEKIVAGACGLLILITLLVYARFGVPSSSASEFLPPVEKIAEASPRTGPPTAEHVPTAEEQAILQKLSQQRKLLPGEKLVTEKLRVPEQTFEYISAEANWLPELNKLGSAPLAGSSPNSRRKIFNIQENSIVQKLGLKENDVIELLDGQIVEFDDRSATHYLEMFNGAMKKLRDGQSISVTVTRNGRPVNIEFKL